ncbi:MAG TPA: ABC transporter permease [Candidatus Cloacimonadota bacterium]|nr:ABC transporter permease [Candidatus Cloacimonadota bacterium]
MFFKNLKYFWRSIKRDKTFAIINLFGMIAGIIVALLAGFYAFYQLSYDKFIKDHDRIYRLEYITNYLENITHSAHCSESLANVMKNEIPGIEDILEIHKPDFCLQLTCEDKPIALDNWIMTTRNFLDLYDVKFIFGSKESGLLNRRSLLLTESLAKKYFGEENPIGKEMIFSSTNATRYIVSGVIKDLPSNSHILSSAIALDYSQWPDVEETNDYDPEELTLSYKYIYLILGKNTSIDQIIGHFPKIKEKYLSSYLKEQGFDLDLAATKISDTHFQQGLIWDQPTEDIHSIYYFLLIALVVIIISIINFINLSMARFAGRNVDIGIRKTLGASKRQIFRQYISESYLFILLSFILALSAFYYLLPTFADFMGLELENARFSTSGLYLLIPILLVVGFLSGFYPALITAHQNPQFILQNRSAFRSGKGNRFFIILQLVLAIVFFVGTLVISLQLNYSNKKEKGYQLQNVIAYEYYNFGPDLPKTKEICEMLMKSAYINDVAVSANLPGQELNSGFINAVLPEETVKLNTKIMNVDANYLPFAGIELLYGRNFSGESASDSAKVIVNATFAKTFGLIEESIGKRVYFPAANENEDKFDSEIIGVVSDFHFQSLHNKIAPLVLTNGVWAPNYYHIKYKPQNLKYVLEDVDKVFAELSSRSPFAPVKHFPEDELIKQYEADEHLSQMTIWLAILSIVLSILGVFGLTAFLVRNNLKMLCLRKIFGAEMKDLFKLLLQDYSLVLLVANVIALPLAWYVCNKWLERFAYHISLPVWLFVSGIAMSVFIVMTAIIYHVFVVSNTDPVKYLHEE